MGWNMQFLTQLKPRLEVISFDFFQLKDTRRRLKTVFGNSLFCASFVKLTAILRKNLKIATVFSAGSLFCLSTNLVITLGRRRHFWRYFDRNGNTI
jgi:hypothetical protein